MSFKSFIKILKNVDPAYWAILGVSIIFIIVITVMANYGLQEVNGLKSEIISLRKLLDQNTILLQTEIKGTEEALSVALTEEKKNVSDLKDELKKELGSVDNRVGNISGAVNTLEKLAKTDPELLQKYSKVFFLNEHYEPPRMIELPDKYEYDESRNHQIHAEVWPYLKSMLDKSSSSGVPIYVYSAFRSFSTQEALKGQYSVVYGAGTANQFSADQGYSEHQLGTTVDLITTGIGGTLKDFELTTAYNWLQNNAHKYGFVLSYPENNVYYLFEPWHWRYVGIKLATELYNTGKNFYDLDQRKIDEYLVNIFD